MEERAEVVSPEPKEIAPVWRDWHTVGDDFRRFERLPEVEQKAIMHGETVASEVVINDDMLWGSVFRYEASMKPEALAAVFHDYDGQYRFVPGMPESMLEFIAPNTYSIAEIPNYELEFTLWEDGTVKSLIFKQPNKTVNARKKD